MHTFVGEGKFGFEALFSINFTSILPRSGDAHVRSEHVPKQHVVLNDLRLVLRKPRPHTEGLLRDIPPSAQACSLKDIVPQSSVSGLQLCLRRRPDTGILLCIADQITGCRFKAPFLLLNTFCMIIVVPNKKGRNFSFYS